MRRLDAYCGLFCGACSGLIKQEQTEGCPSAMELVLADDETACCGCAADDRDNCEFVLCNKNHGTESCAFCPEFPCEMLHKFLAEWKHHENVLDNLIRIKEIGREAWVLEQTEYWKCKACGTRSMWYQTQCPKCTSPTECPF